IMLSGVSSSNFNPLGLMTTSPLSGSRALMLPLVHATRLLRGSSMWSSQTSSRSRCSFIGYSFRLIPNALQPLHHIVRPAPKVVVEQLVLGVDVVVDNLILRNWVDRAILQLAHRQRGGVDVREDARRDCRVHGRAER